jgi:hypothetical protein
MPTNREQIILFHLAVTDRNWEAESGEDLMTFLEHILLLFVHRAVMDGHSQDRAR